MDTKHTMNTDTAADISTAAARLARAADNTAAASAFASIVRALVPAAAGLTNADAADVARREYTAAAAAAARVLARRQRAADDDAEFAARHADDSLVTNAADAARVRAAAAARVLARRQRAADQLAADDDAAPVWDSTAADVAGAFASIMRRGRQ